MLPLALVVAGVLLVVRAAATGDATARGADWRASGLIALGVLPSEHLLGECRRRHRTRSAVAQHAGCSICSVVRARSCCSWPCSDSAYWLAFDVRVAALHGRPADAAS